jgi:hypothetical protein
METHTAMMVGGAVGGAIGGAVGVVGSLATSLAPHLFQRYRDKKAARAITRAYISGILHMEEFHDHAHWYEGLISVIELDENQAMKMLGAANADMNDFLRPTVIAQLGLLKPDVAGDLMLFLNMHDGLRINLTSWWRRLLLSPSRSTPSSVGCPRGRCRNGPTTIGPFGGAFMR